MRLCDDGHDEVCFEGKYCPVCEKIAEIKELQETIERLENELKEM